MSNPKPKPMSIPTSIPTHSPAAPTLTHKLAQFICTDADRLVTPAVRHAAVRALLDTVAVTIAGGADDAVRRLESSLEPSFAASPVLSAAASPASSLKAPAQQAGTSQGCYSPWSGTRHGAADAALLYGMAGHMFDYDDVSMLAVCHPSAPVLSALIAACGGDLRARSVSGHAVLTALCVGTEVLIRLGQAMGFRHYELGFHATATLGTVGAAAAVARLAGLDPVRTGHALAIAASMSGGLQKNFGSMVKPLHVGLAAANGLRAVRMAQAGMLGASEAFEAGGFLRAFSGGATDHWPPALRLGEPFALAHPGFEQKRYPCCYMMHKIIEATLWLKRQSGCTLDQVRRVRINMPQGGTRPLIHPFPKNGLHGKFSAPYAVVASLADGRMDLASFTDEAVLREGIQARLQDVDVMEVAEVAEVVDGVQKAGGQTAAPDLGRLPVSVMLMLHDGSVLEHTVVASPGSPDDPLTLAQLRHKWTDCFGRGLPTLAASHVGELFDQGLDFDSINPASLWLDRIFTAPD